MVINMLVLLLVGACVSVAGPVAFIGLLVPHLALSLIHILDGLTYSEIAHKLGVSISSVKKYVAKAVEHCLLFRLEYGL